MPPATVTSNSTPIFCSFRNSHELSLATDSPGNWPSSSLLNGAMATEVGGGGQGRASRKEAHFWSAVKKAAGLGRQNQHRRSDNERRGAGAEV